MHAHLVIHTVAHLMNVINFSNKFDPLLGELNMAEYKGQNPVQLLVSGKLLLLLFSSSLSSFDFFKLSVSKKVRIVVCVHESNDVE